MEKGGRITGSVGKKEASVGSAGGVEVEVVE
jgi:hypothetical protein